MLIARVERADDAEVHGDVLRLLGVRHVDEDVAGVHVGVKEVVAEHLREEDLDAVLGEPLDVVCRRLQLVDFVDRMPKMRSIVSTFSRQKSQYISGTYSISEPAKLRLSCAALAASRSKSSSTGSVLSNSATTSIG